MMTLQTISTHIKANRKAKGLSQSSLAEISGVSRAQIDRLENGRVSDIGLRSLTRLLRALDLDLSIMVANRGRPTLDMLVAEDTAPN